MRGLSRSPRRKGRLGLRVFSRSISLNPPFGSPCFKLPLGVGTRASGLRREGGGQGGGATLRRLAERVAGLRQGPCARGCGLVPGAPRGVRCARHKASPSGAGQQLLCNLSPSPNWGSVPRRRRRLQPGCRGRRERPKEAAPGSGTCGPPPRPCLFSPCTPESGGRGWPAVAEGPGAARLTWRPRGCERLGEMSARVALRRVGAGRPGLRATGVEVSASSLRGFPGSCSGGSPSRISPLIFALLSSPPLFSSPFHSPPSSWLLQCGGCGYLVNCNCGPLQWERFFLFGFYIYGSKVF